MPFVSFSAQHVINNSTLVSNVFCEEYLPTMNGDVARVYLYGLYLCGSCDRYDNTIEHFSEILKLEKQDINDAFTYLKSVGLVEIIPPDNAIKYVQPKSGSGNKKYNADKYSEFNVQIQAVIEGRMITPNEYREYHLFLETFHVEPVALVMITKYCVDLKGTNVGYNYILAVAKNWAYAGIKTADVVEEKLVSASFDTTAIASILKLLKTKRNAEPDDYTMLEKWREMGYALPVIEIIAKNTLGGMQVLDETIETMHKQNHVTQDEVENYYTIQKSNDKFIKKLLTTLGLTRSVMPFDRDLYNTWTATWKFTSDIIEYVTTLSIGKSSPLVYMNKILSTYFDKKVTSLAQAKETNYTTTTPSITRHSYTGEQLNKTKKFSEVKF